LPYSWKFEAERDQSFT